MEAFQLGVVTITEIVDFADQEWAADDLLPAVTAEMLSEPEYLPAETYSRRTGGLRLRFGGYLVEGAGPSVLVDCGVGANKRRSDRPWNLRQDATFLDSLLAAGRHPEDVEVVVLTHAHVDHVGWLTTWRNDGWEPTFPHAAHVFARPELDHALALHAADPGANFGSIADSIVPLLGDVELRGVEDGHELAVGMSLRIYPGHTPGNAAVWVTSAAGSMVLCGDTVHHPIQLRYPDLPSAYCDDPSMSARSRRRLLEEAARTEAYVIPGHVRLPPRRVVPVEDHFRMVVASPD